MVAAYQAAAAPGYLPLVGPPALRFEDPASLASIRQILPAVQHAAVPTNPPSATNDSVATSAAETQVPATNTPTAPVVVAAQTTNEPTWTPPVEPMPLYPQMFLPYFARSAGTNGAAISVPLTFLPPAPLGPPPSSSTTYEVTPATTILAPPEVVRPHSPPPRP